MVSYGCREQAHVPFDLWTILFLALAVFIFLRLRSVLGQRTGRERPPYSARDPVPSSNDKVVALPGRGGEPPPPPATPVDPAERPAPAVRRKPLDQFGRVLT